MCLYFPTGSSETTSRQERGHMAFPLLYRAAALLVFERGQNEIYFPNNNCFLLSSLHQVARISMEPLIQKDHGENGKK